MPDITFPNTVTSGQAPVSADISENLYTPRYTPDTLEVVNGRLSKANLDATLLPLPYTVVRPGSFAGGAMVGATTNLDIFSDWFVGSDTPRDDIDSVGVVLPGASMTYDLPFNCTVVYLRWHLGVICDGGDTWEWSDPPVYTDEEIGVKLKLFVDGHPVDTYEVTTIQGRWSVPDRSKTKWNYNNDTFHPDHRWWMGEAAFYATDIHTANLGVGVRTPLQRGLHTASIRLAHTENVARVKVRSMAYSFLR